jgi:hypothetical protein
LVDYRKKEEFAGSHCAHAGRYLDDFSSRNFKLPLLKGSLPRESLAQSKLARTALVADRKRAGTQETLMRLVGDIKSSVDDGDGFG